MSTRTGAKHMAGGAEFSMRLKISMPSSLGKEEATKPEQEPWKPRAKRVSKLLWRDTFLNTTWPEQRPSRKLWPWEETQQYHSLALWSHSLGMMAVLDQRLQVTTFFQNKDQCSSNEDNKIFGTWEIAQLVKCLLPKYEGLSWIPRIPT